MPVGAEYADAQELPAIEDTRHSMLRQTMLGLIPAALEIAEIKARQNCVELAVDWRSEPIEAPHGDLLLDARCSVVRYHDLGHVLGTKWFIADYHWTLTFGTQDPVQGSDGVNIVAEEETVLFEASSSQQVRPVWHARFESDAYAVWRSVTAEIVPTDQGTILLGVMWCFNGTGGCGQEFLNRHRDRGWFPVRQDWLNQLPSGFDGRIWKGMRIDPATLQGEGGFYRHTDPNCCPSQRLLVHLSLQGDSLVLIDQAVAPWQQ